MQMIDTLKRHGIRSQAVLDAMAKVPRHLFIPETHRNLRTAYSDRPAPIGHGQTISQPFIVAHMTERLDPKPDDKILEVGTGSGYQAAVLAEMGARVYSVELVPELARHAAGVLEAQGYKNVHTKVGDGYEGWPEHAPFDAVIVTAAPEDVPQALVDQLKDAGRMIVPVGEANQQLVILRKQGSDVHREPDLPVRFVPMVRSEQA